MYGLAYLALYVTAVIAHAQLPTLRAACGNGLRKPPAAGMLHGCTSTLLQIP